MGEAVSVNLKKNVKNYDHKWESTSILNPWTQRDHSWNTDEFDSSNEVKWHEQTKSETGGEYNKPDYGEAVYSGDGKPSYTFSNQGFSLS